MIEKDTVRLLRECDAGVKMGVSSLDDVIGSVKGSELKTLLTQAKREHEQLSGELQGLLERCQDDGKEPPALASAMSELKTKLMLVMNDSDGTITDLMTDGCNMGVKSLSRYLNQYAAASEDAKEIAKRLIALESNLSVNLRPYL